MSRRGLIGSATVFSSLAAILLNCIHVEQPQDDTPSAESLELNRVFLLGTERLAPPAVFAHGVFKPAFVHSIDENDPTRGRAIGFFVTVAAAAPESLKVRVINRVSGTYADLIRTQPPVRLSEIPCAEEPRAFNTDIQNRLHSGEGVYWITDAADSDSSTRRLAVLLGDELVAPFVRLIVYQSDLDGTPVGGAEIELVEDFFYLAIIGDSVLWGNGLREKEKFTSLVADIIERSLQKKVVQQRYAQSGARIVPAPGDAICGTGCFGEVPRVPTSITEQADLVRRPELVDLVLMDGCINDVSLAVIIDPSTDDTELAQRTIGFCETEMEGLLRKVRSLAPTAHIVVTGYFPFVSPESDLLRLQQWADIHGIELHPSVTGFAQEVAENAALFAEAAHAGLAAAVDTVNTEAGGEATITLAIPGFGPENAVFAPNPWLWGMTRENDLFEALDLGLDLFPEDPIDGLRIEACLEHGPDSAWLPCLYASVGHPNVAGARVYADAVIEELRANGVVPR